MFKHIITVLTVCIAVNSLADGNVEQPQRLFSCHEILLKTGIPQSYHLYRLENLISDYAKWGLEVDEVTFERVVDIQSGDPFAQNYIKFLVKGLRPILESLGVGQRLFGIDGGSLRYFAGYIQVPKDLNKIINSQLRYLADRSHLGKEKVLTNAGFLSPFHIVELDRNRTPRFEPDVWVGDLDMDRIHTVMNAMD